MKSSKISLPGPIDCEYCGALHQVTRLANVPYFVAGGLLLIMVIAWFAGVFQREVFIFLFGVWLLFDVLWSRFVPLQVVNNDTDDSLEG